MTTSIAPFTCEPCSKTYSSKDSLRDHQRRKHPAVVKTGPAPVPDIRKNSVCFVIKTSRMTVRRTVSRGDVKVESTVAGKDQDQEMVTVAKDMLDSPELRAIATFDHVTKLRPSSRYSSQAPATAVSWARFCMRSCSGVIVSSNDSGAKRAAAGRGGEASNHLAIQSQGRGSVAATWRRGRPSR